MTSKIGIEITIGSDLTQFPPEDLQQWLEGHKDWNSGLSVQYRVWQDVAAYLTILGGIKTGKMKVVQSAVVGQRFKTIK